MSDQTARRIAWSVVAISVVLVTIGLVFSIFALIADDEHLGPFPHQFFTPLLTIAYGVVGALVASRHPRNSIGWMFCATGFLSALNMLAAGYDLYEQHAVSTGSLPGAEIARWLNIWVWIPNVLLPFTFLLLLFPEGRLLSVRWRVFAWAAGLGTVVLTLGTAFYPGVLEAIGMKEANPFGIPGSADVLNVLMTVAIPLLLIGVFGSIASVVVRFKRAAGIERAQLKWLAFAGVIVIIGNIAGGILYWLWPREPLAEELYIIITDVTIVNIAAAAGIAILRYRLWDIDILINRTLVYFSLTGLIASIYVIIVGSLGMLFQTGASLPVSLFATGIVAMSFQPLQERLQHGVNHLLYGERNNPYAVLGRLAERLEVVIASQYVLPTITETVAEALKLPYAAIALREGENFVVVAEYVRTPSNAAANGHAEHLPLIYQSETIGQLILAPRAPGESFSQNDRQLLETIARQAGIAARNVRLTQDLQRSRERLVTTREEERRRLRRDLHDGLGPALAAMSFKLDAASNLAGHDPEKARILIADLKTQIQTFLAEIRRIAYNLRPPALDELGLVGALQENIASTQAPELLITLEAPETLPPLAAAVEVAAYRITLEAIHNVNRHAHAQHCWVRLSLCDNLCLEIIDDGRGLPAHARSGVGMVSMRERAEELGGTCVFENRPGQGTRVSLQLPLMSNSYHEEEAWKVYAS